MFQAARLLGVMTSAEIKETYEQVHQDVFGESIEARRARKSLLSKMKTESPDDYFDIPAIERKR